jgi:tetratricopeptide (TPR) repeat protein
MRLSVWALLLILTSRVGAQTEPVPRPLVPTDESRLSRLGEAISVGELRIPPKAVKEIQRSQTALRSGNVRSSALHLERALEIYPQSLEVHNNLGSRYIELHEYEKATVEFQKAIEIDPRVMQPFNNLSVAYFLLQRYADAEAAARRALDLDPLRPTSRYMLGCILATEKRNPLEAMEMLRQTKGEFPDSRLLLAEILLRRGAINDAKTELREYLAVPGAEKKQNVERWLARLMQTPAATNSAIHDSTP